MPLRNRAIARIIPLITLIPILTACVRPASSGSAPWALQPDNRESGASGSWPTSTPFMPAGKGTEQVYDTPTPNPPADIPPLREETDSYTVQPGDSLMTIALRYGVTAQQIIDSNNLGNPDLLEVGQVLQIPAPVRLETGPGFKLIPDSELVNGPAVIGFDVAAVVDQAGGFLSAYVEDVDKDPLSGAAIVARIAREYSVNPRVLLALLEYQAGWLTQPDPAEKTYPIGLRDAYRQDLFRQLAWAADQLNRGYYLWRAGGLSAYALADGSLVPVEPHINAGTAGLQYFFAQLYGLGDWETAIGAQGFAAVYRDFFGYPFQYAIEPLLPVGLQPPVMQLPFEPGVIWSFTGGPHGGWGDGSAWAALDFAPPGEALGCVQSNAWVTAVSDGLIVRTGDGQVIEDLDSDGNEQTGWVILYMHVESRGRVETGSRVRAGDRIGHPSCEGGFSTGTHLHLARKYNGEWIPADLPAIAFTMDGWTSTGVGNYYDGWLVNGSRVVVAENGRSEENEISR